jgi:crossover junction endodeoxyribonuclease RusA
VRIELPWPSRDLHPNARVHWGRKAKAAKAARRAGYFATLAVRRGSRDPVFGDGRIHLWVTFYPPDRRTRDDDGLLTAFKPWRDGIADGMLVDDSRFVSHPYVSEEVVKGGLVVVTVTSGPDAGNP